MYVRFVIKVNDERSGRNKGLFMAMGELKDNNELFSYEKDIQKNICKWFDENLDASKVQSSESNHYTKPHAISWFKSSATEHINKMREYAQILEAHDVSVIQLNTERPGKVVYEDEYQMEIVPAGDSGALVRITIPIRLANPQGQSES